MEILEQEKRRARNQIWNAARDYSFEPEFKVYDLDGQADLYWNSIIGAVRKNYGAEPIDALFKSFHGCENESLYEQLIWLGLENAVYQREASSRPALPSLRIDYANYVLSHHRGAANQMDILEQAHFRRALGMEPSLAPWDRKLLDALEFSGNLNTEELTDCALKFLRDYFGFVPGKTQEEEQQKRPKRRFSLFRHNRDGFEFELSPVRSFGRGFGEHTASNGGKVFEPEQRRATDKTAAQTQEAIKRYVAAYFGEPLYDERITAALEDELCTGNHKGCHLYYSKGSANLDPNAYGYVVQ